METKLLNRNCTRKHSLTS